MTQLSLAQPTSSKVRENSIAAEVNTSSISAGPTTNDNRSYVSLARTALRGLRSPGQSGLIIGPGFGYPGPDHG